MNVTSFRPNIKKDKIFINVKAHAISIILNTFTVLTFDKEGRLIWAYLDGYSFKRSFDNKIIEKYRENKDGQRYKIRKELKEEEKKIFLNIIHGGISLIYETIKRGEGKISFPSNVPSNYIEDVEKTLSKVAALDYEKLEMEKRKFLFIYKPVSILPPDQYLALVLQVTEGCWWNKCTFCDFYRDRKFRVKSDEEVLKHIKEVKEFLVEGIWLRRSIFLADANALTMPEERLIEILNVVNQEFPIVPKNLKGAELSRWKLEHPLHFSGIYSFLDAFIGKIRSNQYYRELKERNLNRIYLGLESGSNRLLNFLQKPNSAEEALEVVQTVKESGINVGVIVMIGNGGEEYFEEHIRETVKVINSMELEKGDFLYLSEFIEHPGLEYPMKASEFGIKALSQDRVTEQIDLIRQGIKFTDPENLPKIAIYDLREFIY